MWKPEVEQRVFYSEILDKFLTITVTKRALDQIDECKGFDAYILEV